MPPTLLIAIALPTSLFVIYAIWKSTHISSQIAKLMGDLDDGDPTVLLSELTNVKQRAEELTANIAQLRSIKGPRTK